MIPTDILSMGNIFIRQDGPETTGQKESKCKAPGVRPDTLGSVRACCSWSAVLAGEKQTVGTGAGIRDCKELRLCAKCS